MRITVEMVRDELRRLAAEQPDRVDRRAAGGQPCRYVSDGRPSCLVAEVLHNLGVSVGALRELDREPGRRGAGVSIHKSRHPLVRRIDPAALDLLAYVQFAQDTGQPWGATVEDAFAERRHFGRFRRTWLA